MTDVRVDLVKEALIDYLYTFTEVVNEIPVDEIREYEWQGSTFLYPNIRIGAVRLVPTNETCTMNDLSFTAYVFSEENASSQADKIAGIIRKVLHAKGFSQNSLNFYLRVSALVGAYRSDNRTWRSEVQFSGRVSG